MLNQRIALFFAVVVALLAGCSSPSEPTLVAGSDGSQNAAALAGVVAATPLVVIDERVTLSPPGALTVSVDPDAPSAAGDASIPEATAPANQQPPAPAPAAPSAIQVSAGNGAAPLPDTAPNGASELPPIPLAAAPPTGRPKAVIPGAPGPAGTPLVIFDTDLGPDIDDALALAMLHGYQKRGAAEIAAVTLSRNSTVGARYADALNTFYGRPNIPVGIDKGNAPYFSDTANFVALADSYPHDLRDDRIEEAYKLQRRILVEGIETGRPVIIIQVGFSGNLSKLVDSPGDEISQKTGIELIKESVSVLSVMAGSIDRNMVEFNVQKDVASARNLFAKWPGRLVLSPFELGYSIHYPYSSIQSDLNWTGSHPIKASYEFRDLDWHEDSGAYYDMRTWDLTAVMETMEPHSGYFLISQPGRVTLDGTGRTSFSQGGGQHYVLDRAGQYSGQQKQRVLNRMIELVSDRP